MSEGERGEGLRRGGGDGCDGMAEEGEKKAGGHGDGDDGVAARSGGGAPRWGSGGHGDGKDEKGNEDRKHTDRRCGSGSIGGLLGVRRCARAKAAEGGGEVSKDDGEGEGESGGGGGGTEGGGKSGGGEEIDARMERRKGRQGRVWRL